MSDSERLLPRREFLTVAGRFSLLATLLALLPTEGERRLSQPWEFDTWLFSDDRVAWLAQELQYLPTVWPHILKTLRVSAFSQMRCAHGPQSWSGLEMARDQAQVVELDLCWYKDQIVLSHGRPNARSILLAEALNFLAQGGPVWVKLDAKQGQVLGQELADLLHQRADSFLPFILNASGTALQQDLVKFAGQVVGAVLSADYPAMKRQTGSTAKAHALLKQFPGLVMFPLTPAQLIRQANEISELQQERQALFYLWSNTMIGPEVYAQVQKVLGEKTALTIWDLPPLRVA